jgi:hypothetical protein
MSYGTPPPPPGYGAAQPAYGGVPQPHPKGTTVLVLGILGLVCCGVAGIFAWVMGNTAIKEIDANPAAYDNRGTVQAGRILGIISVAFLVIGVIVSILWVILVVAAGVSTSP